MDPPGRRNPVRLYREQEGSMRSIGLVVAFLAAVMVAACGSDNGMTGASGGTTIMLTDSPFSDARAVLVSFSEVSAHKSGGDFVALPFAAGASSRTCDLKKLVGAQDVLGTGSLSPGHYTQLRLTVSSAAIYFDAPSTGPACAASLAPPAGRNAPVDVPSGEVKLNREFDVTSASLTITLDFDGDASIRATGNGKFMMTPVISVVGV